MTRTRRAAHALTMAAAAAVLTVCFYFALCYGIQSYATVAIAAAIPAASIGYDSLRALYNPRVTGRGSPSKPWRRAGRRGILARRSRPNTRPATSRRSARQCVS